MKKKKMMTKNNTKARNEARNILRNWRITGICSWFQK
jgi:hypothetical protein